MWRGSGRWSGCWAPRRSPPICVWRHGPCGGATKRPQPCASDRHRHFQGPENARLPGRVHLGRHTGRQQAGNHQQGSTTLVDDKVRFVGDPVALVAGETLEAAEEADRGSRWSMRICPPSTIPWKRWCPNAPAIHEKGNLLGRRLIEKGDVEEALKNAARGG